jgi:hypothetical protein
LSYSVKFFFTLFLSGLILSGCKPSQDENNISLKEITPIDKAQILNTVQQQRQNLSLCNQEKDQALSDNATQIYVLNNNQYLVEVLCFLGAYQGNYEYLLANKSAKKLQKIDFPTFTSHEQSLKLSNTSTIVGTTQFDPLNQILIIETKARGLGDCGSYVEYQWQNSAFELKEYRDKSECDGVYIEPKEYPLIYP